jgi:hypothetical protein
MSYNILCKVTGGVTGNRSALLKHKGVVVEFRTRRQAESHARQLEDKANGDKYRTALFSYTAQEAN